MRWPLGTSQYNAKHASCTFKIWANLLSTWGPTWKVYILPVSSNVFHFQFHSWALLRYVILAVSYRTASLLLLTRPLAASATPPPPPHTTHGTSLHMLSFYWGSKHVCPWGNHILSYDHGAKIPDRVTLLICITFFELWKDPILTFNQYQITQDQIQMLIHPPILAVD